VTLTDLKEAQKTYSLSHQDGEKEERNFLDDRSCLSRSFADDRGDKAGLTESTETTEISLKWSKMDEVTRRDFFKNHIWAVCSRNCSFVTFADNVC